ncbi:CoA transferase [Candidatus Bealeia paramacronuclearis]|uniref:CoA transferase n=2 Tax=Candidatus Bealeia paramacronuclearis TaxID=1921001 RepID=A0ABZ2C2H8_9PROT|nr:CoA transferase [Candidatus Bealeia paramacronuclearis]
MTAALENIRVIDLTRVLAGPTCTQILGDLGADVIKIEHPKIPDITRSWGPPFELDKEGNPTSESAYYLSCNRNKKSILLDFTTSEGKSQLIDYIKTADVFVENFKTGTLKRYGLDYEALQKIKPDIIYCSITGFGQTGPFAEKPGYDFQVQGMSGLMSLNGEPEGAPLRAGISLADISTGVYSALGIMTALYHRARTGEGQYIDMALFDCQMAMLSFAAQSYLLEGKQPSRTGNAHPNIVPYGAFEAQNGHVILAIGTDDQFRKFCEAVGRPEIIQSPKFSQNKERVFNREILIPLIQEIMGKKTVQEWVELLDKLDIPCGPVNSLKEAFSHPQALARELSISLEGLKLVASPLRLSKTPPIYSARPPRHGEQGEKQEF